MQSRIAVGSFKPGDLGASHRSTAAQSAVLLAGAALALLGLIAHAFAGAPLQKFHLAPATGAAGLACAIGLFLSFRRDSGGTRLLMRLLAIVTAVSALAGLTASLEGWNAIGAPMPATMAAGLVFLAVLLFFLKARSGAAAATAEAAVFGLGWTILTLVADELFQAMHVFDMAYPRRADPAAVWVLTLLGLAAMARRMDRGMFGLFLGHGKSSRITRDLVPLVLILPFFREVLRAKLIASGRVPEHSATAAMASTAAMVSVGILLAIGYAFRRLEDEIRELSLRDELTGLYNLRGFRLLADQAFRLAQRSNQPFSVLFVDVDELKAINDEQGHAVGSSLLVQTAELLRSSFRETDVVGRIGGDEFAVAGQFDSEAIEQAAERLAAASVEGQGGQHAHPGLSIGHVTAGEQHYQSLERLLAEADAAMYLQKRSKKQQVTA
jgi:diguanylate cyclase (GGDEF)-like protein